MRSAAPSPIVKAFLRHTRAAFAAVEQDREVMRRQFNHLLYRRLLGEAEHAGPFADLFARYEFTLDENRTDAISPEMLGTVFETFLHQRHRSGSYYTPKSVVTFMCREVLKGHLEHHEAPEAVERFVEAGEANALRDAEHVFYQLIKVRVCDPACGSGAFLVGMLHELARLRRVLRPEENAAERLWEIIAGNLYGVDLNPLALEIVEQRLRLAVRRESVEAPPPRVNVICRDSLMENGAGNFNIVITNPPYLSTKHGFGKGIKVELGERYHTAVGQFDAYNLFIERGFELLKPGGHYAYIVPRPVLTNVNMQPIRLKMQGHHLRSIALPEAVFGVDVETVVIVGARTMPNCHRLRVLDGQGGSHEIPWPALITSKGTWNVRVQTPAPWQEAMDGLPKLGEFVEVRRGVECGKRDAAIETSLEADTYPLLRGEDVTPFQVGFEGLYLRRGADHLKFKPLELYTGPKLLVRRVTNSLIAAVDEGEHHVLNTLYVLKPVEGVKISLWYLCGLLNSGLLNRYFQRVWVNDDRLFPYVRKEQLLGLPILAADVETVAKVEALARGLAAGKAELRAELDAVVEETYRTSLHSQPIGGSLPEL